MRTTTLSAIGGLVLLLSAAAGWTAADGIETRQPATRPTHTKTDTLTLQLATTHASVQLPRKWRPVQSGTPGVAAARHATDGAISLGLTTDSSPSVGERRARERLMAAGAHIEDHGTEGACSWLAGIVSPDSDAPVRIKMVWADHRDGILLTSWSLRTTTPPPRLWGRAAGVPAGLCRT